MRGIAKCLYFWKHLKLCTKLLSEKAVQSNPWSLVVPSRFR